MLPSIEYIKTLVNGLKQWVENRVKSVRKELTDKVEDLPQADWDQNDPEARDYVKNRPCYTEYYEETISGVGNLLYIMSTDYSQRNGLLYKVRIGDEIFRDIPISYDTSTYYYSMTCGDYEISGRYYSYGPSATITPLVDDSLIIGYSLRETDHQIPSKYIPNINFNILNGEKFSIRSIGAESESSSYKLGSYSCAFGSGTAASGNYSHAEGFRSIASGNYSHAEGSGTAASGNYSHAEGFRSIASGNYSHAEGGRSYGYLGSSGAYGEFSHSEGDNTLAQGRASHAEGGQTKAYGSFSHAEGNYTIAHGLATHVEGISNAIYTVEDETKKGPYIHIAGNGDAYGKYSNAYTLDWNGNAWFSGDVYTGSTSGTNRDDGSKKLATEDYVDSQKFSGSYNDLTDTPTIPAVTPFSIDSTASDYSTTSTTYGDQVKSALLAGRDVWYIGAETDESGKTVTKYTKVSWFNIEKTDAEAKLIVGVGARTDDNSGAVTFTISI